MSLLSWIKRKVQKALEKPEFDMMAFCIERGMTVGDNCNIQSGVYFDYHHCQHIYIGNNVTIAPQAFILAHDTSTKKLLGYTRIGKIVIEDNVFIGARSIIMPGVSIGENTIIGAGSLVNQSIPANSVAVGNPARVIMSISEYINKKKIEIENSPIFDENYTYRIELDSHERQRKNNEMNSKMNPWGYII
jgi:maltose O-acetyltransferase